MKKINTLTLAGLLSLATTSAVFADMNDLHEMQQKADAFDLISVEQARDIATKTKPGYVDDVDLEGTGMGYKYEVEVADKSGVEWDIDIDAKTGEVLNVKRDD